jgi:hypothetical protein
LLSLRFCVLVAGKWGAKRCFEGALEAKVGRVVGDLWKICGGFVDLGAIHHLVFALATGRIPFVGALGVGVL